jgi:hypothetical protein
MNIRRLAGDVERLTKELVEAQKKIDTLTEQIRILRRHLPATDCIVFGQGGVE